MNKVILGIIIFIVTLSITILIFFYNKKPKTLDLTYKISAGIPFKWQYEIEDETIVKLTKSYVTKNENTRGKVGAPIYTKYIFEGLKEGKTTITFKFINITNEKPTREEKYFIKVDKDKNIELLEKK